MTARQPHGARSAGCWTSWKPNGTTTLQLTPCPLHGGIVVVDPKTGAVLSAGRRGTHLRCFRFTWRKHEDGSVTVHSGQC